MTIQEIFKRIENGVYDHKVRYPKRDVYKDDHVFDGNQTVKWNREQARLKNKERMAALTAYQDEESALVSQFKRDVSLRR